MRYRLVGPWSDASLVRDMLTRGPSRSPFAAVVNPPVENRYAATVYLYRTHVFHRYLRRRRRNHAPQRCRREVDGLERTAVCDHGYTFGLAASVNQADVVSPGFRRVSGESPDIAISWLQ